MWVRDLVNFDVRLMSSFEKSKKSATLDTVERQTFFTIEKISAGEELLWDYVYHQKVKGSNPLICICGELAESCRELKVTNNHDHVVEAILKHVGKNADGNRKGKI